jgi:hypothetical protein
MMFLSSAENKLMWLMGRTPTQILERRRESFSEEIFRLQKSAAMRTRTCKTEDDVFFDRLVRRGEAMQVARCNIDDDILRILNTFPIDTPCTTKVIANRIGMHIETIERVLIEESRAEHRDDSDSSKRIFEWNSNELSLYSHTCYIVKTICQPNWRFVDSGKYLERYEKEN